MKVGDLVIRSEKAIIGRGSIGTIIADGGRVWWVEVTKGRDGIQDGWEDVWAKNWSLPYKIEPDWRI